MRWIAVLALFASCAGPTLPPKQMFNDVVLQVISEYPTDGSYGYHWPKTGTWEGTTEDIYYQGVKLCSGDPQKRSYCCGLMFEVFMKAWRRARGETILDLDAKRVHELRLRFFGDSKEAPERRKLVQFALTSMGLGIEVPHEEARPGDFVQFWRNSGSGHQCIFIDWVRENGAIVGIKYWSSQGSTNGIGYNVESIGGEKGIKQDEIYIARVQ